MRHQVLEHFFDALTRAPLIMGVVNVTPDSFSDGGQHSTADSALAHAQALAAQGADLLDFGGESTRPGYAPVSPEDEQTRVLPAIEAAAKALPELPLSVDTYRASTALKALEAGAVIVNDIWGLQKDPDMAGLVGRMGAGLIVMHNREEILLDGDLIDDMSRFFTRSLEIARKSGIPESHILLDPGLGFGKTGEQNEEILARLPELASFGLPLLVGASRKRFIGTILNEPAPDKRGLGSVGAHLFAVAQGARVIRVHDVAEHKQALMVFSTLQARMRSLTHHV